MLVGQIIIVMCKKIKISGEWGTIIGFDGEDVDVLVGNDYYTLSKEDIEVQYENLGDYIKKVVLR